MNLRMVSPNHYIMYKDDPPDGVSNRMDISGSVGNDMPASVGVESHDSHANPHAAMQ